MYVWICVWRPYSTRTLCKITNFDVFQSRLSSGVVRSQWEWTELIKSLVTPHEKRERRVCVWVLAEDIVADHQKRSLITTSRGRQRSFTHLSLFFFHVVFFSSSLTVCFSCFAPPPNSLFYSSVFTSFYYSFVFFFFSVFILFPPHVHFFSLHFPLSLTHHLLHFCSFALSPWSSFW